MKSNAETLQEKWENLTLSNNFMFSRVMTNADICTMDIFGYNYSCYEFEQRCVKKPDLKLDDSTHKLFYNAQNYMNEKNPEIRAFLEYLCNGSSCTEFTKELDKIVIHARQNSK